MPATLPLRTPIVRRLFPALLALAALPSSAPGENYGRELAFGEKVTTYIMPAGDTDDFVFDAAAGWKVAAAVKNVKDKVLDPTGAWNLAPTIDLVSPDGTVQTSGVVVKASKTSAKLTATLTTGGRFALRVRGVSGTGGCALTVKFTPAVVAPIKNHAMGANTSIEVLVPARGGALLSWTLKFKGDGAAEISKVLTPQSVDAGYDKLDTAYVKRTPTSEIVKNFPLPASGPGGNWKLLLENKLSASTASLTVKVALPKALATAPKLTQAEPALTGISHATSTCGVTVTLTGTDLGTAPMGVFFGTHAATGVTVDSGKTVTCQVPGGSGLVDVRYVAADGQVAILPDAFTFKALPTLTSFDPTVGPGVGRVVLTLYGNGFETEVQGLYDVVIGGTNASQVQVISATELTCQIPAHVAGPQAVVLRNKCGETVVAPGSFNYSSLLAISTVTPNAVPVFGGIPVTVYGAGFASTDSVWLDGNQVTSTPLTYSNSVIGHVIAGNQVPAHAPGAVDIQVKAASGGQQSTKVNALAYYTFTDITSTAIPAASSTDDWGAVSTAGVDADQNGTLDWIVLTHSASLSATRPGTRILLNNGSGVFSDATASRVPEPDANTDYGANKVLAARFNADAYPDIFLSRPGTGTISRKTTDQKYVMAWDRLMFSDSAGILTLQPWQGATSRFAITGTLTYPKCYVYDFDYRSATAALGDLDGDLDQDVLLVNDRSLTWYQGINCNYKWITCAGGYYPACYSVSLQPVGSALRFCTVGSSGGFFDRTSSMLVAPFSVQDDFRGAAAAVGDMTGDFLNDVVVTNNTNVLGNSGGANQACTRFLKQTNVGIAATFARMSGFLPQVTAGADDWRGDAVAVPDLNGDLLRDMVVSLDADLPNGAAFSTRILIQDPVNLNLVDRTSTLLSGILPAGDKGYARCILPVDIDRDGDTDLFIGTPGSAGAGNRRTRFLLNVGKDAVTGIPSFMDASSLLPAEASDPGNAVGLLAGDVDGDGNPELILTDTHLTSGTPVKRTRVFKQVR